MSNPSGRERDRTERPSHRRLRAYLRASPRAAPPARRIAALLGALLAASYPLLLCAIEGMPLIRAFGKYDGMWSPLWWAVYVGMPWDTEFGEGLVWITLWPCAIGGAVAGLVCLRGRVAGWDRFLTGWLALEVGAYVAMTAELLPSAFHHPPVQWPFTLLSGALLIAGLQLMGHVLLVTTWLGSWAVIVTTFCILLIAKLLRARPDWILTWPSHAHGMTRGTDRNPQTHDGGDGP